MTSQATASSSNNNTEAEVDMSAWEGTVTYTDPEQDMSAWEGTVTRDKYGDCALYCESFANELPDHP